MLEELIYSLIEKRRKILGGIIGFIFAILFLSFGFFGAIFIFGITILGYYIVDTNLVEKFRGALVALIQKIDNN